MKNLILTQKIIDEADKVQFIPTDMMMMDDIKLPDFIKRKVRIYLKWNGFYTTTIDKKKWLFMPTGKKQLRVIISSAINPDFHDEPWNVEIKPDVVFVESLQEAREVCLNFIKKHNLGGGNWNGGDVFNAHNTKIAKISYNGRIHQNAVTK